MLGLTHWLLERAGLAPPPQRLIPDRERVPRVLLSLRWGGARGCGGIASSSSRKEKTDLMASESPRKRLQEEVTCPVCLEYFANPVTLVCEHSCCHSCILHSPTSALCPLCERAFRTENLKLNYSLASFVEITKLLNDQEKAGSQDICKRHQKPLKLFCKDDEVLICISCEKEHQGHSAILVEEAAQQYQDHISASLEALKKQKEEMMATISATQEESEDLLNQMETERQKMAVKFRDLWPFLKKQEGRMLARMKRIEKQMETKKDQHMDQLSQPLSSLRNLIQEMEEKKELPATQLLQDVGGILKRSEQKVEIKNLAGVPLVLKQKVSNFTDSPSLDRAMKKLKDSVASCY